MTEETMATNAAPSGDRVARQLAAMRLLFDATRDRHETDVILATVFETLADGVKRTTDELLRQLETDWPGVVIAREKLESTLEVAADRNYLRSEPTLGGSATWAITGTAELGVDDSRKWARGVLDRCRAQVQDLAGEQGIVVNHETAEHWTNLLLEVLHEGMIESFTAKPDGVREVGQRLFPPYDREKVVIGIHKRIDDADTRSFLVALAISAFDPGSLFGSEVVHYLATGYILHALLLGLDLTEHRKELSVFRGEVLLLDTPVLLRLLSGGNDFKWTSDLLGRIARGAGAIVAVTSRTWEEFNRMLASRDNDASKLQREIEDGVPRKNLAAVAPDEVLAIWLSEPKESSWDEFKQHAASLLTTLKAMGVDVDYLPDGYVFDETKFRTYVEAIQNVTGARGNQRHERPTDHDALLLCIASHVRSLNSTNGDRVFPGVFVVTTDKALNDAYRVTTDVAEQSLALSVSQVASLLARLAQPDDAEKLAELIATDLQWQTRFERATLFGIDHAIDLARSFNATTTDALLVEANSAELTFDELLRAADYDGDPDAAARAAILQQERRRRSAHASHNAAVEAERLRNRERAARAEAETKTLREVTKQQSAALADADKRNQDTENQLGRQQKVRTRQFAVAIAYLSAAMLLLGAVALDVTTWRGLIAPAVVMVAATKWLFDWARDPDQPMLAVVLSAAAWVALAVLGRLLFA